jgi:hypothetical protein
MHQGSTQNKKGGSYHLRIIYKIYLNKFIKISNRIIFVRKILPYNKRKITHLEDANLVNMEFIILKRVLENSDPPDIIKY